ncbi:ABC a-pheromone efflux pump [Grosmannia clavigera kw1407]|uniref:ABC a-pheromone efflux pump n=1 Tax=Grosmannia clavigera (strain kw1407 / UAMH 11150) TaxID=655863 RepID=F0XIS8_GROCL|nr:ABC a-pheromone efflux pump [Grosmannia clavigera kw1407]EFX02238.1 ABC a-pheromone efflux pump [Grosmannia clavigera kw1407]
MEPVTESLPLENLHTTGPAGDHAASVQHLFVAWTCGELSILVPAVAASAVVAGAKTAYALILGEIFQTISDFGSGRVSVHDTVRTISTWCLGLVGLGAGKALISFLMMVMWITHGESRARSVRLQLFQSLLEKEMAWFDTRRGGMSSLMTEQNTQVLASLMGVLVTDCVVCVACLVVALVKSWKLTLGLLASVPIAVFVLSFLGRGLNPAAEKQREMLNQAAKHATAALVAIDLVKVYDGHDTVMWQYLSSIRLAAHFYIKQALSACFQMGFVKLWMVNLFVIGFWFGMILVGKGQATAGNVLTAFYAVLIAFQSIEALGTQWVSVLKGTVSGKALEDMIFSGSQSALLFSKSQPSRAPGGIELSNVSFAYPSNPNKTVLKDCSMLFPSGQVSFVVGRSGSGKSTIADLLVRFYHPTAGRILVDKSPIEELDVRWLRENVSLIQQSSTVFNGTFGWNVSLGSSTPDSINESSIKTACQTALLQSTIAGLPQGLDTVVGPRGVALSGGQRQRLAVARAKIRDPAVLVLDETTSGLDPKSAQMVLEAVRIWRREKTTVIITHDISNIAMEDYVYVMDCGSLVQQGPYFQLAKDSGGMLDTLLNAVAVGGARDVATACLSPVEKIGHDQFGHGNQEDGVDDQLAAVGGNQADEPAIMAWPLPQTWRGSSFGAGPFLASSAAHGNFIHRLSLQSAQASHAVNWPLPAPEPTLKAKESPKSIESRSSVDLVCDQGHQAQANRQSWNESGQRQRQAVALTRKRALSSTSCDRETSPPKPKPAIPTLLTVLRTVWPLLGKANRIEAILGLLCCIVVAGSNPGFSFVFARMLESFWSPKANKEAVGRPWALILIGLSIVDGSAVFGSFYLAERVGQTWVNALRSEALTRLMRQPRSWWSASDPEAGQDGESPSPSRIVECLDRGGEEMRKLVSVFVPILTMAAGMVITSVGWSLAVSWRLTLVALASGPIIVSVTHLASRVSNKWESRSNWAAETVSGVFSEVFPDIRVVRALTLETHFSGRLAVTVQKAFRTGLSRAWRTGILYGLNQALSDWLTALVFYYGVSLLTSGDGARISVSDVVQVVNLLLFSIGSAASLLSNVPQIAASKAVAAQILEYASLSLHASHEHSRIVLARPKKLFPVRMDGLVFRYPGKEARAVGDSFNSLQPAILHGINLEIRVDDFVAIVGTSGSGKSTILSLLLRLYESDKGNQLTFDGMPADQLDTKAVRSRMAYVPQHPYLFPASVRANITYGLDEASPLCQATCVADAARAASIDTFVSSLTQGYDTVVGDVVGEETSGENAGGTGNGPCSSTNGSMSSLSGGQAQRVCIARALLRRPQLLVLDEPTSSLDAESAQIIRTALRGLADLGSGRSIVVATHSKAMMRLCDRVVVVQDGTVVTSGPYAELLQHDETFARLVGEYDD